MTAAQAQAALVIDDDAAAREAAAAALSEAGFMVKQAESGTRGLGKLIGFRPNLIVLDMTMPVMSGVDFCKQLIKYEIGDIPVLGVSDPGEKSQFEAKFDGLPLAKKSWAGKPLAKEALLKAARELTGQTAAAAVPQGPQKLRILLIDDEADIRSLLRLTLKAHHEIAEAENGMAGLAMLEQFQPDFVICDIMMPIMNGLETVEAIRKNPKFYDIPVFFLSGEKHPDLPELTMEAGGNLFLEKPIDPRRLMELVHLFVDEMGITPRVRDEMPKPAPPPKDAAPKP
ncbi:response regulator, partial [Candidatus Sumerlaeota bacterium]|nr:response regulator [Candidatus Sumerlaeota bacterium]